MSRFALSDVGTPRRIFAGTVIMVVALLCSSASPVAGQTAPPPVDAEPLPVETPPAVEAPPVPVEEKPSLTRANELLFEGSYDEAAVVFESLAASAPGPAVVGLARCRLAVGRYDDALTALTADSVGPSADAQYWSGVACMALGRHEDALRHVRSAIDLDRDHTGARLLLGQIQEYLGNRDDAIRTFEWFEKQLLQKPDLPRDAAKVTDLAVGLMRYTVLTQTNVVSRTKHVLNEMLQVAYERLDRHYWPARIAAADLLRERYNNSEHDGSIADYEAALRINPRLPEAHVGMGLVALENWAFEEVERRANQALEINPRFAPALHLLARKSIVERRYQDAIATCDKALELNPRDLIAMAIRASASACRFDDTGVESMQARAAEINPRFAGFHRFMGDALGGIRQYAASEAEYRKTIELDPTDCNAYTELGMMNMQWGVEDKARDALDRAWAMDPFNQRTKFTLDLLDMLQHFAHADTENFVVRYNKQTDPGMGDYLASYMEEIYAEVTSDYATPLTDRTIIEMFPTHRQFSVRITGKPWIPTVGACSGRVIALASPRDSADTMGAFNFARVLKHEFTHTVTLAATNNRIPHWFTEGLAVYQEDAPRPFEWCELLADAARRDDLFTLESIDWGFMRPRKPTDRTMAYAQSEWMCEYIVQRFGYDVINRMLRRYHDGATQPDVMEQELNIATTEFDRDFHAWARTQILQWGFDLAPAEDARVLREQLARDGESAELLGRIAKAEFDDGNVEEAVTVAQRAVELNEREPKSLFVLAKVLADFAAGRSTEGETRTYRQEAEKYYTLLLEVDPKNWAALNTLAEYAVDRDDLSRAEELFTKLQAACPIDPASWRGLAGVYLQRGETERALPQLTELSRLDENDGEVVAEIGRIHRKAGRLRDAQHWFRQALYIMPMDADLHRMLAEVSMQAGDASSALREYRMLTRLAPNKVVNYEKAAIAAQKLGLPDEVQRFAKRAVELDPASPAKTLLAE